MHNIPDMSDGSWRIRLADAIEGSGKSRRAISLESGNGPGYVHSILSEGKDPSIDNLLAVCDAVPVSAAKVLLGINMAPEDVQILQQLRENPDTREGILAILRAKASS